MTTFRVATHKSWCNLAKAFTSHVPTYLVLLDAKNKEIAGKGYSRIPLRPMSDDQIVFGPAEEDWQVAAIAVLDEEGNIIPPVVSLGQVTDVVPTGSTIYGTALLEND